jgi:hypothetical protein
MPRSFIISDQVIRQVREALEKLSLAPTEAMSQFIKEVTSLKNFGSEIFRGQFAMKTKIFANVDLDEERVRISQGDREVVFDWLEIADISSNGRAVTIHFNDDKCSSQSFWSERYKKSRFQAY